MGASNYVDKSIGITPRIHTPIVSARGGSLLKSFRSERVKFIILTFFCIFIHQQMLSNLSPFSCLSISNFLLSSYPMDIVIWFSHLLLQQKFSKELFQVCLILITVLGIVIVPIAVLDLVRRTVLDWVLTAVLNLVPIAVLNWVRSMFLPVAELVRIMVD